MMLIPPACELHPVRMTREDEIGVAPAEIIQGVAVIGLRLRFFFAHADIMALPAAI